MAPTRKSAKRAGKKRSGARRASAKKRSTRKAASRRGTKTAKRGARKTAKRGARKATLKRRAKEGLRAARGGIDTVREAGERTWDVLKSTTSQVVEGVKDRLGEGSTADGGYGPDRYRR
jgi:hypothetical protein